MSARTKQALLEMITGFFSYVYGLLLYGFKNDEIRKVSFLSSALISCLNIVWILLIFHLGRWETSTQTAWSVVAIVLYPALMTFLAIYFRKQPAKEITENKAAINASYENVQEADETSEAVSENEQIWQTAEE